MNLLDIMREEFCLQGFSRERFNQLAYGVMAANPELRWLDELEPERMALERKVMAGIMAKVKAMPMSELRQIVDEEDAERLARGLRN